MKEYVASGISMMWLAIIGILQEKVRNIIIFVSEKRGDADENHNRDKR